MNDESNIRRMIVSGLIIGLLFILAVSGCKETAAEKESLEIANAEEPSPGLQFVRANTPVPSTPTPFVLAATFTPIPTVTLMPLATPRSEEEITLRGKRDFGNARNPLTGELLKDPDILDRRPIAVKISNAPANWVRPQSGLSKADLVFEHVTEGLITRFTAILYSQTPPTMGPIRSARLIDLQIPLMYDAALAYSGSSIGVSRKLFASEFRSRILRTNETGYYRTGEPKPYEHTLYARPKGLWESLEKGSENHKPEFQNYMAFSSEPPDRGQPAKEIQINYRDWTTIVWRFDAGKYWRWVDGDKHLDANTGEQINASNVIVLFADHTLDRSICEHQSGNTCLAFSTEIDLLGSGEALLFRDGQRFEAIWRRQEVHDLITLHDQVGNPVYLDIGKSWFQVIPNNYPDPVRVGS